MLEKYIKDLSPELQEKARKCGSKSELLKLAKSEKVELSPEALEAIAGGKGESVGSCYEDKCPKCGSKNVDESTEDKGLYWRLHYKCRDCGYKWYTDEDKPW